MTIDWRLRLPEESVPEYGTGYEYFSIYMHQFERTASNEFKQCTIGYIDYCSSDKISMLEVKSMAGEVGIQAVDGKSFFWLHPGKMLVDGLRSLESDNDTIEMSQFVDDSRIMHVYIRDKVCEYTETEVENMVDVGVITYDTRKSDNEDGDLIDSDYDLQDNVDYDSDNFFANEIESFTAKGNIDDCLEADFDETENNDSDVLLSYSGTDEDDIVVSRKPRYVEFNEEANMVIPPLEIGMKFQSFEQFKRAAKQNAIRDRVEIKFHPNNKKRCKAYCKRTGCAFYIWASLISNDKKTVQIKSGILKHDCPRSHHIRHVNAIWIANNYMDNFKADPTWSISGIIQAVKKNEKVDISRLVAWRARSHALKIIDGDERQQIASLHDYRLEVLRSNPGSTVKFKLDNGVYKGMYICLAALKSGFKEGCRRLISVDGCFLKGTYGGQLLTAVGIDANDCIYSIAYAAVGREDKENWLWFLEMIAEDLEIDERNPCSFMSDRQKGLLPAVEQLFPYCEHRFCVRHILANFKLRFQGKELKDTLWNSARASHLDAFKKQMDKLAGLNKEAYQYLKNIPPRHWTRSHFLTHVRCDMLLNNLCESFNSWILDARTKGLITMCEMIRTKLMKRIHTKRDMMKKCQTVYCPKILKKLEKNKQFSWFYQTEWSGGEKYQVSGLDGQFVVDTQCKTCSCRRWDLTGIPCCHAISALYYNNDNPSNYIDDCYKVSTYLKTYSHLINPTNGKDMWPKSNMPSIIPDEPPKSKKGRRQVMRRKEPDEGPNRTKNGIVSGKVSKKGIAMHCSLCGSTRHNKRFHEKKGNAATQSIPKKLPVKRKKNVGQSGGSDSISMPHTLQWMPDGTTRYPKTFSANVSEASKQFQVIDVHEDHVPSKEAFSQGATTTIKMPSTNNMEDMSLHVARRTQQDVTKSVKHVQNMNRGKVTDDCSAGKRKIWVPSGHNYADASFTEWSW